MAARLYSKTGELAGSAYEIDQEATIGRGRHNTVVLHPNVVSTNHARIYFDADRETYMLEDLNSGNGTKVDGVSVKQPVRLGRLHVITFANRFDFVFQVQQSAPAPLPQPEAPQPEASPAQVSSETRLGEGFPQLPTVGIPPKEPEGGKNETHFGAAFLPLPEMAPSSQVPRYALEVTIGSHAYGTFALQEGENVIGRTNECDVAIKERAVSRQHAVIMLNDGTLSIKDLGSKNATFVDGQEIQGIVPLKTGAVIHLARHIAATVREQ